MKLINNYPIYLAPTLSDIEELGKDHWDTLRILVVNEIKSKVCPYPETLVIASGYGNTHNNLIQVARTFYATLGYRHIFSDDYIAFHVLKVAYFNVDSVCSTRDCQQMFPSRAFQKFFNPDHAAILTMMFELRGLKVL